MLIFFFNVLFMFGKIEKNRPPKNTRSHRSTDRAAKGSQRKRARLSARPLDRLRRRRQERQPHVQVAQKDHDAAHVHETAS